MKRKLFSAILFGALLTASTSGLTSCKDYDDDISNLQSQIDKLATADQLSAKVSEMQAAISAAQSAAESKAAAAQSVADAAKSAAADAAAKAQSAADEAAKAKAAAAAVEEAMNKKIADLEAKAATKDDLEAAKKLAADAVAQIIADHATDKAAIEKSIATTEENLKAEIKKVADDLAALAKRLDAVETKLAALEAGEGQEEALKAIQEEVEAVADALEAIIGEYTSMVTSVDLYTSNELGWADGDYTLKFVYVDQEKDTKFPAAEGVADEQITFSSANKNVMTTDKLLVRVSPTNAVLNAANISLLNSQGADLSDYVEVKAVKPFEELILGNTRAAEGNGLWEVEFKVKDGVDAAKFADAVSVKKGLTTYGIKYAVAVQNTESEETRRVISSYDVEVLPEEYEPARTSVNVTNRDGLWHDIKWIRNRYQFIAENKPGNIVAESATEYDKANELAWDNEPDVAGGSAATVQDQYDNRNMNSSYWNGRGWSNYKLIDVEVGGTININVGSVIEGGEPTASNPWNATSSVVKGFYVTLDSDNAIESAPSEINAWESYSYTNVGVPGNSKRPAKMFYGNEGSISIDSPAALGDIIGFRVYVVNLDGTLVDPDGRAFYVNVATEKTVAKLAADEVVAELVPVKVSDGIYDYHFNGTNLVGEAALTAEAKDAIKSGGYITTWTITSNASAYGNNVVDVYDNNRVWNNGSYVNYDDFDISYDLDKNKVYVTIKTPYKFLDNGTYTAQATVKKNNGTEVCDLTVSFKKVLPEYAPALAWGSTYDPTKQIFANVNDAQSSEIYKLSAGSQPQAIELNEWMQTLNYGSGVAADSWYTLSFANSALKNNKATEPVQVPTTAPKVTGPTDVNSNASVVCTPANVTNYVFAPAAAAAPKVIDGESHEVSYTYNYGWISMTFNKQTAMYTMSDWNKPAKENLAMTFASWIHYEQIALAAAKTFTYTPGNANGEVGKLYIVGKAAGNPTTVVNWSVSNNVVMSSVTFGKTYKKVGKKFYRYLMNQHKFVDAAGNPFSTTDVTDAFVAANGVELEMSKGTDYVKYVGTSSDNGAGVDETGVEFVRELTGTVYKKISNGDFYKAKYVAAENTYKFVDASGKVLNNQTEENVKPITTNKLTDGDDYYYVYVWANGEKPGAAGVASDFVAWNTVISNYQDGKPVFGNAGAKVKFDTLVGDDKYLTVTGVDTGANDPFKAELIDGGKTIKLTQKTGTLNPGSKGTLTIKFADCFGIEQSRTVEYNIAQ